MKIKRANLFGAELTVTTYEELLQITDELIAKKPAEPYRYNFCNVHVVMMTLENEKLKKAVNHAKALSVTDGMPLVWALRKLGNIPMEDRVYGPTFFEKALNHRSGEIKHFFYGSTEETVAALLEKAKKEIPGLLVAGTYIPPFRPLTEEEKEALISQINKSEADIVWVCLGAPKQEVFIDEIAPKLNVPIMAAVGAAFAFYAGKTSQAPAFLQRIGMEWFYRLLMEPRRLFVRYFKYNPWYLWKFFAALMGGHKLPQSETEL
ncbi:WecB/TagA/CpsF family glycosyltransferase [bacterium]|nr:WecB/TagA/CpsF family glycosyltransferase [bacterium]